MQKAGRITAGLLILAVGAALFLGETAGKDYIREWSNIGRCCSSCWAWNI